mgnify:CR=1 FL=1
MAKYGSDVFVVKVDVSDGGALQDMSQYVDTIGGFKVERAVDKRFIDLGPMMTQACFEKFCEDDNGTIVAVTLGKIVLTRSTTLSPPS